MTKCETGAHDHLADKELSQIEYTLQNSCVVPKKHVGYVAAMDSPLNTLFPEGHHVHTLQAHWRSRNRS